MFDFDIDIAADRQEVLDEIALIKKEFGYDEDTAIGWIRRNIAEYGSVFKCELNKYIRAK